VLSTRSLCDGPIRHSEQSYRVRVCVCVCLSAIARNKIPLTLQMSTQKHDVRTSNRYCLTDSIILASLATDNDKQSKHTAGGERVILLVRNTESRPNTNDHSLYSDFYCNADITAWHESARS